MVRWLRLCAFNAEDSSLTPGQGTKIPQAVQYSQKEKEKKNNKKNPKTPRNRYDCNFKICVEPQETKYSQDFPGGPVVKNLPATGDMGLVPGSGRFHKPWDSLAHVPQLPKTAGPRADAVQ